MHCLCRMCRRVLLVVLWLLIGTRSRLLVVGLLSIAEACAHSVSLWNHLSDPVFDGVGLAGFKSRANAFLLSCSALSFFISYYFIFFSLPWVGCVGIGVFGLIKCSHSLPALHSGLQNNNNNKFINAIFINGIYKLYFAILIKFVFKTYFIYMFIHAFCEKLFWYLFSEWKRYNYLSLYMITF